jgi:hypothetical protein
MSLFGKLLKTAIDVATLPIDVAKDAATMGGLLTDKDRTYTGKKFKRLGRDAKEIRREVDEL